MNTKNINKLIPAGVALFSTAFLAVIVNATTYLPVLAVVVSYTAVAVLAVIAVNDYKARPLRIAETR